MKDEIYAFPMPMTVENGHVQNEPGYGMTLRDYFAAKAMQGVLSCNDDQPHGIVAFDAYRYADAMLKARGE